MQGTAMLTYEQAAAIFEREFARSNGFGIAGLTLEDWAAEEVKNFFRVCDQSASRRGASLKGALVGMNVARKLGIENTVGKGDYFEDIPCFVTSENDRLDLLFGSTRKRSSASHSAPRV